MALVLSFIMALVGAFCSLALLTINPPLAWALFALFALEATVSVAAGTYFAALQPVRR